MSPLAFAFSIILTMISITRALPTELQIRQAPVGVAAPACAITCAAQVPPDTTTCSQAFMTCLSTSCLLNDYNVGVTLVNPYCAGQGIVHTQNGVPVTDVPPPATVVSATTLPSAAIASPTTIIVTEYVTTIASPTIDSVPTASAQGSSSTIFSASSEVPSSAMPTMSFSSSLRSPAAITVYIIVTFLLLALAAFLVRYWRRKQQGDYILPSHRRTRGKSFLIDGSSITAESIELTEKAPTLGGQVGGDERKVELNLEDRILPLVPIPTKDSSPVPDPLPVSSFPSFDVASASAVTHPPSRSYTALPGRESTSSSGSAPPGLDRSPVSQSFAAGRERALAVLGHTRSASSSSSSSSLGSSSPSTPSGNVYAAAARAPLPAYTYQPNAPSPLRGQLNARHHQASRHYPPISLMHATVGRPPAPAGTKATQRIPTIASHTHQPRSAETLRQFTFPNTNRTRTRPQLRESLDAMELQITISEALRDGPPPLPPVAERSKSRNGSRSRSATPNGSMHRGAGGSMSSIAEVGMKVQEKFQAIVGGMRKEQT